MKPQTYLTILITITILLLIAISIQRFKRWLKKRKLKKRITVSQTLREAIFIKYNYECALCRSDVSLEIHHRDNIPSNNKPDNLLPLCHNCHRKHRMKN